MTQQIKDDAWLLGFEWAMGDTWIDFENPDLTTLHLQIMPEFEEGVETAILELKKRELQNLITGETYDKTT